MPSVGCNTATLCPLITIVLSGMLPILMINEGKATKYIVLSDDLRDAVKTIIRIQQEYDRGVGMYRSVGALLKFTFWPS